MTTDYPSLDRLSHALVLACRAVASGQRTFERLEDWLGSVSVAGEALSEARREALLSVARVTAKLRPELKRDKSRDGGNDEDGPAGAGLTEKGGSDADEA